VIFGAYIKTKQIFHIFYCLSHFSTGKFYNRWKVIIQNQRIIFLRMSHETKTSFSLFIGVTNWDM